MDISVSEKMSSSNFSTTNFPNFPFTFNFDFSKYSTMGSQEIPFNHSFRGLDSTNFSAFIQNTNFQLNSSQSFTSMAGCAIFNPQLSIPECDYYSQEIDDDNNNPNSRGNVQYRSQPNNFSRKKIFTIIKEPIYKDAKSRSDYAVSIDCTEDQDDEVISINSPRKYNTYSNERKNEILSYCEKHGMNKTIEVYSKLDSKINRRKLKLWKQNFGKVKNCKFVSLFDLKCKVKGKKTNDPARDDALMEWYSDFKTENGRPPNRREIKQKALQLSKDPQFMASKGWLDKFSKKFCVDIAPIKLKISKRVSEASTRSTKAANSRKSSMESLSKEDDLPNFVPVSEVKKPTHYGFSSREMSYLGHNYNDDIHINSYFNFNNEQQNFIDKIDEIPSLENK